MLSLKIRFLIPWVIKLPLTESNSNSAIELFNKKIFIESNKILFFTKNGKRYMFITE